MSLKYLPKKSSNFQLSPFVESMSLSRFCVLFWEVLGSFGKLLINWKVQKRQIILGDLFGRFNFHSFFGELFCVQNAVFFWVIFLEGSKFIVSLGGFLRFKTRAFFWAIYLGVQNSRVFG